MAVELLAKLSQQLDTNAAEIKTSKEALGVELRKIREAKRVVNNKLIDSTKKDLELVSTKPAECKEDIQKYKDNLQEVLHNPDRNVQMIEYAKRELKDAKIRYKNAKKEVRTAKKLHFFSKHAGDTDVIVDSQKEINNIKLDITRNRLACERAISDSKEYIKSQKQIIKDNQSLVKTKDDAAIKENEIANQNINDAKAVIKKAKGILPWTNGFKKFYANHRESFEAFLCLLPAFTILIVFMIFPLINTFVMSFMEGFIYINKGGIFAIGHGFDGIGLSEYITVLTDPIFIKALKNTVIMVIVSVPLTVIIALFISVALNGIKKLQGLYQTIFFLPYVTNTIALGMVFNIMFSDKGLINKVLGTSIQWLTSNTQAGYWASLAVLTCYTVWSGLAFKILIFLSGLQSIDKQYYDAALIDGASRGRIFRKITVPLLSPMILYTVITSFIGAFKAYSNVIAVFGGGKGVYGPKTDPKMWITMVGYIYDNLETGLMLPGQLSKASAGAVILLIIILLITILQFIVSKKRVHY